MSVTRAIVRSAAKGLAQDAAPGGVGTGVQLLLNDPVDYNTCIDQALAIFSADIPNRRIVHVTLSGTAYRFILAGDPTLAILRPQAPAQPSLSLPGTPGTRALSYRIVAKNAAGDSIWSAAVQSAVGPTTLNSISKAVLTWAAVPGASSYDVYGNAPLAEQLMGNVSVTTFTDNGSVSPSGALGVGGLDGWVIEGSEMTAVWLPYIAGVSAGLLQQGQVPIDENEWQIIQEPGPLVMLELLHLGSNPGQILRLEFTSPHLLDDNSAAYTTVRSKWIIAFETLVAALLLRIVANRYLQNTGSVGLPNDIVDRRSQSDQASSRAKEFMQVYKDLIGGGDPHGAASGFKDLDVGTQHNRGSLWHPEAIR